uniref:RNA polymerase alpha subunit n=1 Tax=Panagrolaimus sp. PS1159 TaxID=55785 RepID=A0AC35FGW9_9BILA
MAYSNSVIKANHFLVELLPEARNGFLLAMQKFGPNHKTSRTFTESNIPGIESLSIITTYENIVLRNNFSPEYICDLNNEFELVICGKYSNYMVNLPFTIINKKEQWSLCCKINFTLHLSQLLDKGLYVVVSIPLYGIQAVINYNCFTKDVTVTYRLAVLDGTLEDRNKASSDGCKLFCLNVDIIKNKIDKRIFEAKPTVYDIQPPTPLRQH